MEFSIFFFFKFKSPVQGCNQGGEAFPALSKDEKFVPEFSLKDYEILTNEHWKFE